MNRWEGRVEQAADSGLLDEAAEYVVNDQSEVSEEAIDRVSRRRSIEATAGPDGRVLEFSGDRTRPVDSLVEAVKKAFEQFWRVMISCSPPASGGEHVILAEKVKVEVLEERKCLDSHEIKELVYPRLIVQGLSAAGHGFSTLPFRVRRIL